MEELTITRDIELDLPADDLWTLVSDGAEWGDWLADDADVVVVPGGGGSLVDDGVRREVRIDAVEPGRRVAYRWWPTDEPDAVSSVELVVLPLADGSALRVTERLTAQASAALRWEVRAAVLWSHATALVRA